MHHSWSVRLLDTVKTAHVLKVSPEKDQCLDIRYWDNMDVRCNGYTEGTWGCILSRIMKPVDAGLGKYAWEAGISIRTGDIEPQWVYLTYILEPRLSWISSLNGCDDAGVGRSFILDDGDKVSAHSYHLTTANPNQKVISRTLHHSIPSRGVFVLIQPQRIAFLSGPL
ncbi:uncharacterized protein EV420DRAFT_110535 [Desarmillaria tabescens]|uniref:Uncharacterized protein n=1 Tax=Armillaria tabescens TaxID=1929756 RepID=A0AA39NRP1_ARMTA|nr:uncharacterized protein EV420DRAFT_110535 [Desarmillaria tabescens]KAK0470374.1 hypothetical protein EV420DRAFT_110535 [Desarmillaria tabescens]